MYDSQPPQDLNSIAKQSEETAEQPSILERAEAENLSTKNVLLRQQQLQRLFIWLLLFGLGFGAILGTGVVIALKKFGLAEKPYQKENVSEQEPTDNDQPNNLEVEQQ